jgi:hypothetical protein
VLLGLAGRRDTSRTAAAQYPALAERCVLRRNSPLNGC